MRPEIFSVGYTSGRMLFPFRLQVSRVVLGWIMLVAAGAAISSVLWAKVQEPLARAQMGRASGDRASNERPPIDIPTIHRQPFFWTVMGASFLGWALGMVKGFEGSKEWLNRYWPTAPRQVLFVLDFAIFVVVGAYVGTGLYQPANFTAALGAGLTWPVALGALASRTGSSTSV